MRTALRQRAHPTKPPGTAFCACVLAQPRACRGFLAAFLHMGGSVDDLQIGHAPIDQQRRPLLGPPGLAPHREQRHAVIDFGVLAEPRAGGGAAVVLQTPPMPYPIAQGHSPLPGPDTAAVPART